MPAEGREDGWKQEEKTGSSKGAATGAWHVLNDAPPLATVLERAPQSGDSTR